jgi:hypothetical protein
VSELDAVIERLRYLEYACNRDAMPETSVGTWKKVYGETAVAEWEAMYQAEKAINKAAA